MYIIVYHCNSLYIYPSLHYCCVSYYPQLIQFTWPTKDTRNPSKSIEINWIQLNSIEIQWRPPKHTKTMRDNQKSNKAT
jgi:hypothetical protein